MSRIIVCTSPGNRYQRRISVSSCGGLFPEKKHSTYKHHLMCYRRRPVHGWSPPWISKLFEKKLFRKSSQFTVIHRQHLVAKNLSEKLHESLSTVITTVTKSKRMLSILDCSISCVLKMTKIFNACFSI